MGKNLNTAQSFLDKNMDVPDNILQSMTREELDTYHRMEYFRKNLTEVLDSEMDTAPLRFSSNIPDKKHTVLKRFLVLPAATLFSIAVGFSLYHTVQLQKNYRELVREETRNFITTLTSSNAWWESTVDENALSSDWFNADPIVIKSSF